MKFSVLAIVLLIAVSCSKINEETIKSAVLGQNYYFLNKDSVSVSVEFLEACARHYDWTVNIVDDWSIKEINGKAMLIFDTHEFEPKETANDELEFFCLKTGESLKKAPDATFDESQLNGNWIDALYSDLEAAKVNKLPIPNCPDGTLKNPSFTFNADNNCAVQDFCDTDELPYSINQTFKIVCIGEPCNPTQIWKIRDLADGKLVIDRKYMVDGKENYEYNKWLLKK